MVEPAPRSTALAEERACAAGLHHAASAPTSTPPPWAEKGARPAGRTGRSCPRPIPRRPDHQIHLACDGQGRPLAVLVTPGQRHDSICARPLLERIRVPRTSLSRSRSWPDHVIADKAYNSCGFRAYLTSPALMGAQTRHRPHRHPGKDRPTAAPAQSWPTRRSAARVRLGDLLPTQHRRTLLQPTQGLSRHRYERHCAPARSTYRMAS
ncbi:hypothetical protein SipoB123_37270 [Streptomyces ipomoeae]|nr:hypothetical protein SipoB123_37270 [Streptomyces ipomoeae]